jgi:ABC-type branched-subunit amino acid transport system permease subunit
MSSNVSVACGAYVVSSVVIHICMWIGGAAGLIGTQWVRLIGYFEDIALGSLLLLFLIFKPRDLIPEKRLNITGINYDGIINEKKMAGEVLRSSRSKDED